MKLDIIDFKDLPKHYPHIAAIRKGDTTTIGSFRETVKGLVSKLHCTDNERQVEQQLVYFFGHQFHHEEIVPQVNKIDLTLQSVKLGCNRVILEVKSTTNKTEFLSATNANRKALHELIWYFYHEISRGNRFVHYLIATNGLEWFFFDAKAFYARFVAKCPLFKEYEKLSHFADYDKKSDIFYGIAKEYLDSADIVLQCIYVNLEAKTSATQLQTLYKLFSRQNLLNDEIVVEHDVNEINQGFFSELLYIMGLEEVEKNGKKVIEFLKTANHSTLSELTIDRLEDLGLPKVENLSREAQYQGIAMELGITWINRLLFIKLLEGKIISYKADSDKFLTCDKIRSFQDLHDLFFSVLGTSYEKRKDHYVKKFPHVPYLNSSLFEMSNVEKDTIRILALSNAELPLYKNTVLKNAKKKGVKYNTLEYLLNFLDAYDYVGDGCESAMIVNAAVLGKVFEKLNGYKDGSFYTPSFVTMSVCHNTIDKTVVARFNEAYGWKCKTLVDVYNKLETDSDSIRKYNELVNSVTVADISVGSGHFLVSALNEFIWIKATLGILVDSEGRNFRNYTFDIENDELIVRLAGQKVHYDYRDAESQRLQKTLFNEKKTIISNCLFGVDINPNSVNICCLRLWIELLKNTYYKEDSDYTQLEILPNIDINIKVGNSLISRLPIAIGKPKKGINVSVQESIKKRVREYKKAVIEYKQSRDKEKKLDLKNQIDQIKSSFRGDASTIWMELEPIDAWRNKNNEQLGIYRHSMEWMIEFPELMDENGYFTGFDCIVGNPPYMRVQEIEKTQPREKLYYEATYVNSTGAGAYDIAFLFVELALKLMKDGRICTYIMPHKYLNSDGAETFRHWLKSKTLVKRMAHFGANQVFRGASTYTCISEFSKGETDGIDVYKAPFKSDYVHEMLDDRNYHRISYAMLEKASELYGKNQWIMCPNEEQLDVFQHIYHGARKVSSVFSCVFQGIATSDDKLYVLDRNDDGTYTVPKTGATYRLEPDFFKPMLKGEDVHKWCKLQTSRYVFFPYKPSSFAPVSLDELRQSYPLTYRYVMDNEALFRAREHGKAGKMPFWYEYIYPKNKEKFEQVKLSSMEICSSHPNVTLNDGENSNKEYLYHNTKVYSWVKAENVPESYKFLLAILNSNLIWWFLKLTGDTLASDSRTFKTEYLNPFPIPPTPKTAISQKIESLVTGIMKATEQGNADVTSQEQKLNAMVYKLYDLDYNQVMAIDDHFSYSREEYDCILD